MGKRGKGYSRGWCGGGRGLHPHAHVTDDPSLHTDGFQQLAHAAAFGPRAHDGDVFLAALAQAKIAVLQKMRQQLPAQQRGHGPDPAQNNKGFGKAPGIEKVRSRRNQQRAHKNAAHHPRGAHRRVVGPAQVGRGQPHQDVGRHRHQHVLRRVGPRRKLVVVLPVRFQEVHPQPNQAGIEQQRGGPHHQPLPHRRARPQPDGGVYQPRKEPGPARGKVLAGKNHHGPVKHKHVVHAGALRAFALVMNDAGAGEVHVFPAALGEAVREVNVLAVHEVVFVEQAHCVEGGFAQQHKGSAQHLYFVGFVGAQKAQVVAPERAGLGQ